MYIRNALEHVFFKVWLGDHMILLINFQQSHIVTYDLNMLSFIDPRSKLMILYIFTKLVIEVKLVHT